MKSLPGSSLRPNLHTLPAVSHSDKPSHSGSRVAFPLALGQALRIILRALDFLVLKRPKLVAMVSVLWILTLAGQSLEMASKKALVQNSGATQHCCSSDWNCPTESRDLKLEVEGMACSSSSDHHELHPPTDTVAIAIDAGTSGDSNSNEVGQTLTPLTALREPEPSHAVEEENYRAHSHFESDE
ncbi:hypothetical protein PCASD_22514 [Puccinia coronata f. sp. avenae]|nr:hypothetical protein PCASD_22514 [Puccinia coronata f. sp. avenae]